MLQIKEEMEGGYRLNNIRKVKRMMYIVQTVLFLVLALYIMWMGDEFSFSPLHIGLPTLVLFLIALALIINIESFVFLRLQVRYLRSFSTKYHMVRSSIRRSLVIIAIAAVFLILFWTPVMDDVAGSLTKVDETKDITTSAPQYLSFYSGDAFSITRVSELQVDSDAGDVYVLIISEENFDLHFSEGMTQLNLYRLNVEADNRADPALDLDLSDLDWGKYYVVMYLPVGSGGPVHLTFSSVMSPQWYGLIPYFAIAFIVVNALWIIYSRPMYNQFKQRAIYK